MPQPSVKTAEENDASTALQALQYAGNSTDYNNLVDYRVVHIYSNGFNKNTHPFLSGRN